VFSGVGADRNRDHLVTFGRSQVGDGLPDLRGEDRARIGALESGFLTGFGDRGRLVGAISVAQSEEIEALVKDLIAERAPTDALARDLVGGRL
jgi:hypothetical protein